MFRKKRTSYTPVIVDIGSQEVKVLTFSEDVETRNVTVHGIGISRLPAGQILHGCLTDSYQIATAIENAYVEAKHCHQNEDSLTILTGVSGIMMDSMYSQSSYQREKPDEKIRPKEWENILDKMRCKIDEEEYRSTKEHNAPMKLVQSSIEQMLFDGVPTPQVLFKKGRDLEFRLFNTYVPESHVTALTNISEKVGLPIHGVFHTMYGVTRLILDNHQNPYLSMVLIDVGEDHTDVAIVKEGILQEVQSFSIGGGAFTQRIASTFEITLEEAESIKQE